VSGTLKAPQNSCDRSRGDGHRVGMVLCKGLAPAKHSGKTGVGAEVMETERAWQVWRVEHLTGTREIR